MSRPTGCPEAASFGPARTGLLTLAAIGGVSPLPTPIYPTAYVQLGAPTAQMPWLRTITIWSLDGLPFNVRLSWRSGMGDSGHIFMTSQGGRIRTVLVCTGLAIEAANWSASANRVLYTIEDEGYQPEAHLNRFVDRVATIADGASSTFVVPPYARNVSLTIGSNLGAGTVRLTFRNSSGTTLAIYTITDPTAQMPVCDAFDIVVAPTGVAVTPAALVYDLSL